MNAKTTTKQPESVETNVTELNPINPVEQGSTTETTPRKLAEILYPKTTSNGEKRKAPPFIRNDGNMLYAKIGNTEASTEIPETLMLDCADTVTVSFTKVSGAYSIDNLQAVIPASIYLACGLAGLAERLNTNCETREKFLDTIDAWRACCPMPSDYDALFGERRVSFSWAKFLASFEGTPQAAVVAKVFSMDGKPLTTNQLANMQRTTYRPDNFINVVRDKIPKLAAAMDAFGWQPAVEGAPIEVSTDDLDSLADLF